MEASRRSAWKEAKRAWYKWLRRRSQQAHLTWEGFGELLKRLPLPRPRITVRIWGIVEISLSGSGEGPGGAIPRGYSTMGCGSQARSGWSCQLPESGLCDAHIPTSPEGSDGPG